MDGGAAELLVGHKVLDPAFGASTKCDLQEALAYREQLWERKFRARKAGRSGEVEELASEIQKVSDRIQGLCIDFNGE